MARDTGRGAGALGARRAGHAARRGHAAHLRLAQLDRHGPVAQRGDLARETVRITFEDAGGAAKIDVVSRRPIP